MRRILPVVVLIFALAAGAHAQDMRVSTREAARKRAALAEKAAAELAAARHEAALSRKKIFADRRALTNAVEALRSRKQALEKRNQALNAQLAQLKAQQNSLRPQLSQAREAHRDLQGFFRSAAQDLLKLVSQSYQTALEPGRYESARQLAHQNTLPSMDHIRRLEELLTGEIAHSGEVRLVKNGPFISRDGRQSRAELLLLGNFTAFYRNPSETGFLLFSDKSRRFFALSRLPEKRWRKKVQAYMDGRSEDVLIDISRGAALRQYTQRPRLVEQLRRGGPIVWPIVLIGILALAIIIERFVNLQRKSLNSDSFMAHLLELTSKGRWEDGRRLCKRYRAKALPRVLNAGLEFHDASREDLENVLQEAILNEIPSIERFLSTLGMLAAIAPLLGLLGTVTGMINTFQAITFFGTGNPRVMSGGISEALITTMLGLAVAIPIMLAHSMLSRKVEKLIGEMEARAVAFVNQVSGGGGNTA